MALEDTAVLLPSGQHLRQHIVPEFDVDLAHSDCAAFIVDTSRIPGHPLCCSEAENVEPSRDTHSA